MKKGRAALSAEIGPVVISPMLIFIPFPAQALATQMYLHGMGKKQPAVSRKRYLP